MAKLSQWQPYTRYVQGGTLDGQFMNASFTLLAAGPPRLANIGAAGTAGPDVLAGAAGDVVFPIGVVQNFNLSHNRQFSRIFEVGSERSFFISGHTMGQMGLSRIMYHGPSLLRVLYAYYEDLIPPTVDPMMGAGSIGWTTHLNKHDVKVPPGFENLYLNLASDLFSQPMGIMTYFRDSNEQTVGSVYLEACYIPNHQIATDSQGTIIQENVGVQFERAFPVATFDITMLDIEDANAAVGILD